ncbi:MAG TPA: hypothetical protein VNT26_11670, partial [Candidatus Sulfotelmatobacter sp.]|nr:hypothetical protein [Candidatus Sulfotelmatobacter sp.]
ASVYPATITVSGLSGVVGKVTVTLTNLSHTYTRDIDMLLVGPAGQSVLLMSDAGGTNSSVTNLTLTLDDSAANSLSSSDPLTSGVFRPANFRGNDGANDLFLSPAPAGPYGSGLSAFNGTDPNGTWSLYLMDDEGVDTGSLGGWSLNIGTASSEVAPALMLTRASANDVLKWPATSTGFKVQTTVDFTWPVSWTNLTQPAAVLNGQNVLTNANTGYLRFYRLRKP